MANPIPFEPPERAEDRGVDANQIAVHINQRPTRIARVDRRIRLQEIARAPYQLQRLTAPDPTRSQTD